MKAETIMVEWFMVKMPSRPIFYVGISEALRNPGKQCSIITGA
jgi:hypothetical protein